MYYGLTNFYQNHRRYVKSRDDNQLLGRLSKTVAYDCIPFNINNNSSAEPKPIAPCGAIANSLFSGKKSQDMNMKDTRHLLVKAQYGTTDRFNFFNR